MGAGSPGDTGSMGDAEGVHPLVTRWQRFRDFGTLADGGTVHPIWFPDGSGFCWVEGPPHRRTARHVRWADPAPVPFLDLDRLRKALEAHLGHPPPAAEGLPFATFRFDDVRTVSFEVAGRPLRLDLDTYLVGAMPAVELEAASRAAPRLVAQPALDGLPPTVEQPSPNGRWLLTEQGNDLALRSPVDDRIRPLTHDGEDGHRWSVEGASWSPDGLRVLALRTDTRRLPRSVVVHWLQQYEEVESIPYPRAGGPSAVTTWWVIDALSGDRTRLDLGSEEGREVSGVRWIPERDEVLLASKDVQLTSLRLLAANLRTGSVRVVLDDPINVGELAYERAAARAAALTLPLNDQSVLWMSERTGWNHLYRYDLDGGLLAELTSGPWPVHHVVDVDQERGLLYVIASVDPDRPYDQHLCRVGLDGTGFTRLTHAPGEHAAVLSPCKGYVVDRSSTVSTPTRSQLLEADGTHVVDLASADTARLEELGWTAPEEVVVQAADGETDLHGVLYVPPDFDPTRSYPVVDCIYGGPQVVGHPTSFDQTSPGLPDGTRLTFGVRAQAMAQLGFVTLVLDARGTPCRGRAFQEVVTRKKGQHEIADHAAGIRQLAETRPWMDLTRVGLTGGSWGGYMTLRGLLTAPDLYSVGVATMLVADHYDHSLGIEAIMGRPQDNPDGYEQGSNLKLAHELRGKLLMIQGTSDVNAPFSAVVKMSHALIQAGRPFDLLVLPEASHHHMDPQTAHYAAAAGVRYLVEHLRPADIGPDDIPLTA